MSPVDGDSMELAITSQDVPYPRQALMMKYSKSIAAVVASVACATSAAAQHAQVSQLAANPQNAAEIWVTNKDNNTVSVIDATTGTITSEIAVGKKPRTLAFSADGTKVYVTNKRGNVPFDAHFLTPFTGSEVRGSLSVIDVASKAITKTLDDTEVGVEPYGVTVAPNGQYLAVTGFRSGWITLFDASNEAQLVRHDFNANLNFIPNGMTVEDLDENRDGLSDLQDPRGFVITSDSQTIYVTHHKSPYISVLDVTLNGSGIPTGIALNKKIHMDLYPFHPIFNPTPVQELKAQGTPRYFEDIALSPDGTKALLPHVLANVNHDVNFDWLSLDPNFGGDAVNRIYPGLAVMDTEANTFEPGVDKSALISDELADFDVRYAEYVPYAEPKTVGNQQVTMGGLGSPVTGQDAVFILDYNLAPGETAELWVGREIELDFGAAGTLYTNGRFKRPYFGNVSFWLVPPFINGADVAAQTIIRNSQGQIVHLSNPVRVVISDLALAANKMGYRGGHPSRVLYSPDGTKALMLNRGSEDIFLYSVAGDDLVFNTAYPERHRHVERTPFDLTTPVGDLPIGMILVDDTSTQNNDSLLYIMNEVTRSLSTIRVNWDTNTMYQVSDQIPTLSGPDLFSLEARTGQELFEDSSRAQTAGNFNNSCASCHFEGGDDANVWQRPAGPRSTMPVYGGAQLTGLLLWKGTRFHLGETGPMFGGENGGVGDMTDFEQDSLIAYHNVIPVPLNPNWDLVNSSLTADAALGMDLFFGENNTGMNPLNRQAGCATCHPKETSGQARFFTADALLPELTSPGEVWPALDPNCVSMQENILASNIRNVNSAVNVDENGDMIPDPDRNLDGFNDLETYVPMNVDSEDGFTRDDPNSYPCFNTPGDELSGKKFFDRDARGFSIPTKLGVFSTPPYFHDHSLYSLRAIVDPDAQMTDPVYSNGTNAYNGTFKYFNEFHDIRGHEEFVPSVSKVQIDLVSIDVDADIDAILSFIMSL